MSEREVDRGSASPETPAEPPTLTDLDEDLLAEGSGVPFADARDIGDPGAPTAALGTSRDHGEGIREGKQSHALPDLSPPFDTEQEQAREQE